MLEWACYVLRSFADQIGATVDIDAAIARLAPAAELAISPRPNAGIINRLRALKRYLLRRKR